MKDFIKDLVDNVTESQLNRLLDQDKNKPVDIGEEHDSGKGVHALETKEVVIKQENDRYDKDRRCRVMGKMNYCPKCDELRTLKVSGYDENDFGCYEKVFVKSGKPVPQKYTKELTPEIFMRGGE